MGGFGNALTKGVGYASGITPTKKLFGLDPHDPNAELFQNPYSQGFIAKDVARGNYLAGQGNQNLSLLGHQAQGFNPLIQQLADQSMGIGPSLVQGQLQQGTNRNLSQALGFAAANRGVNPALAARMGGQNLAQINQQAAFDASQAKMAEQMAARQQLMQARAAQANVTGMGAQLGIQGGLNYQDMAQMQAERDRQARMALGGAQTSAYETAMGRRLNFLSKAGAALGGLAGGGGAAAGASGGQQLGSYPTSNPNYMYA